MMDAAALSSCHGPTLPLLSEADYISQLLMRQGAAVNRSQPQRAGLKRIGVAVL